MRSTNEIDEKCLQMFHEFQSEIVELLTKHSDYFGEERLLPMALSFVAHFIIKCAPSIDVGIEIIEQAAQVAINMQDVDCTCDACKDEEFRPENVELN